MSMGFTSTQFRTQKARQTAVTSPLGPDALLLRQMEAEEELGRLFRFQLDLVSENPAISPDDLLGEPMTVRLSVPGGVRFFSGIVTEFEQRDAAVAPAGEHGELTGYRAVLVPWIALLEHNRDCRIFQQLSVPEIIKEVFRAYGFAEFEERLSGDYATVEYCVQYRESDLAFVTRLMEQEGIYYFFKHESNRHVLVLADSVSAHDPADEDGAVIPYDPTEHEASPDRVLSWLRTARLHAGAVAHTDYEYLHPRRGLETRSLADVSHIGRELESFDFPGRFATSTDGERLARLRMEQIQAAASIATAATEARMLPVGYTFELSGHPREQVNVPHLVIASRITIVSDEYESSAAAGRRDGGDFLFRCTLKTIPADKPFRLEPITRKPVVEGPQTAVVVGKKDEEICTDEHARIKVKFHWDRYATGDERSSCWIRVSQAWAGKGWGAMFLPRIGQEVIVSFLEGDPDRPIVTGRVYNGEATPAYNAAEQPTVSGIKSNSTKNEGGFNEIRFDDKAGSEQIFIHAQRDMDVRISHDRFELVAGNQHTTVEKDLFEEIKGAANRTVASDAFEQVQGDRHLTVDGLEAAYVAGSKSLTVDGDVFESFSANHEEETAGDLKIKASTITLTGMSKITLKVGGSSIEISAGGVTIKAPSVKIDAPDTQASGNVTVSGNATTAGNSDVGGNLMAGRNGTIGGNLTAGGNGTIGATLMSGGPVMAGGPVMTPSVVSGSYTPGAGNIL